MGMYTVGLKILQRFKKLCRRNFNYLIINFNYLLKATGLRLVVTLNFLKLLSLNGMALGLKESLFRVITRIST
jgi:hypothetical protein